VTSNAITAIPSNILEPIPNILPRSGSPCCCSSGYEFCQIQNNPEVAIKHIDDNDKSSEVFG